MRTTWLWLFATLVGLLLLAAPVGAQEAREHFKRGELAYQKGNYSLAVSEWETAYAADPRPRIQYNLYQAYERLGDLSRASAALERYLSTADPEDPHYSDATARMASLKQRLQATGIVLVGGIDGAAIIIGDKEWGRLPRPDRIPVEPGSHRVRVALTGYQDFVADVGVPAGQVVQVQVELRPGSSQTTSAPDGSSSEPGSTSASASSSDLFGGSGDPSTYYIAAAALGGAALISGIWMIERASEYKGCDSRDNFCENGGTVKTQRNVAFGLTALFGIGAVGTLIYGVLTDDSAEPANTAALHCDVTGLGASCGGSF
ncbi:MAG: PEGA domain-containing protein [Myxococcales bacterium]|nr:PEGA domain-containing protein [Myxococcales bacterium]